MKCAISQSNYIPWRGYFQLISEVDVFVFYDDVQFTKRDWRSRNRIMTPKGPIWLTIPVGKNRERTIEEVGLPNGEWRENHLQTIRRVYSKQPHFETVMNIIRPWFENEEINTLSEFNQGLIQDICEFLGIKTQFIRSSELGVEGGRVDRLIRICNTIGAEEYLSGPAAKNYIDDEFENSGIKLSWMEYGPFERYPQIGPKSVYEMSIIDTMIMLGEDALNLKRVTPFHQKMIGSHTSELLAIQGKYGQYTLQ